MRSEAHPSAAVLFDHAVAAVTSHPDRRELQDLIRVEHLRREAVANETNIFFEHDPRDQSDASVFDEVSDRSGSIRLGDWARTSAVLPQFGRVLYRVALRTGGPVLEIGTGTGLSAAYLGLGLREASNPTLVSIEPNLALVDHARELLKPVELAAAQVVPGRQEDLAPHLLDDLQPRLIHIDSDHRRKPLDHMLSLIEATLRQATVLCLDDIRWSEGMSDCWNELRAGGHGTVGTIDLGLWGIAIIDQSAPAVIGHVSATVPSYMDGGILLPHGHGF